MPDTHMTTFRPTTCACVVTHSWDINTTEDNRVHAPFCIGPPLLADQGRDEEWVCEHHRQLLPVEQHPGLDVDPLIRLVWHKNRCKAVGWNPAKETHDGGPVGNENVAVGKMRRALLQHVPRAKAGGPNAVELEPADGIDIDWQFVGSGASRELIVGYIGVVLTAQERALLRAEAAKQRIKVTVR